MEEQPTGRRLPIGGTTSKESASEQMGHRSRKRQGARASHPRPGGLSDCLTIALREAGGSPDAKACSLCSGEMADRLSSELSQKSDKGWLWNLLPTCLWRAWDVVLGFRLGSPGIDLRPHIGQLR